ncbi:uncharacterized protein DUF421 [Roseinatronobacter thiooxidans]|uniref:Uncharacterized protein DUF421 n=1 Tax=Roseinatronobacter thiooxidans TaxID=121821 RepID=A0A2W7S5W6_9RHOB|nr:YetF domain-containing protein [Roseinatronobacter thiooxidans]PZX45922.1 uncharacterized protein DUF421 [Roseinatronobacter thiooxidans]
MADAVLFDSWAGMARVAIVGLLAYAILILMLRISGKRTLSKMNAFDLVVTVALGSTLATVLLNADIPLAEGILALALLIALQYVITWLSVRSEWFEHFIKSEPTLLVHQGRFLDKAMRKQRVTREEIGAVLRANGKIDIAQVQYIVLETDGTMTVVPLS